MLLAALLAASAPAALADEGTATWYGQPYHGRRMANGQVYDMNDPTTAACNLYPLGTWLRITNPANGRSVVVQVRDRGSFSQALDLSYAAFAALADPRAMRLRVRFEVVSGPDAAPASPPVPTHPPAPPPPPTATPLPTPTVAESAAAPPAQPLPLPSSGQYVVQPGETLGQIAQRYGLDPQALAAWNGLTDPDLVVSGQTLTLVAPPGAPAASPDAGVYIVQEGDVPWQIAERAGVTTEALLAANNLSPDAAIVPGQALRLPRPSREQWYTVAEGDTLTEIAARFATSADSLLALNHLDDADLVTPGEQLRIR